MQPAYNVFYSILLILTLGCNPSNQADSNRMEANATLTFSEDDAAEYDMDEIYSAIRKRGEILLIYGSQQQEIAPKYKTIAQDIKDGFKRIKVIIKSDEEVSDEDLKNYPIYLMGSLASNKILKAVKESIPFHHNNQGFEFNERSYQQASDHYILGVYPNPYNPKLSISIISGNDDNSLIKLIHTLFQDNWRRMLWNAWGYQIFRDGKRTILGQFSRKPESQWAVDQLVHWDFESQKSLIKETEHFKLITHGDFDENTLSELLPSCENTLKSIEDFTEKEANFKLQHHIYNTLEDKGLLISNTEQANVDFRKLEVHTVINEEFKNNYVQKENELILRQLIGKPNKSVLEQGLAIHFTKQWQREGYQHWASKLYESGNLIPIHELLNNELFEKESQLVFGAMAGVFCDFLIEKWGKDEFLNKYQKWNPDQSEIAAYEKAWDNYFKKTIIPNFKIKGAFEVNIPKYFKGFNFAHEGYNIYNGYISQLACTSLDSLISLGSNAVAIVPYSYMGNPNKPSFLQFSRWPGSETDESVIHSSFQAKKRGMHSLLKPQIWLGRSWPGDVEMSNDQEWEQFFEYYNRWMRHYALLAEIHQMDMLCIGVEFAKATIQRPKDWITMANSLRKIYSGPLTYAANWGEEAENAEIWHAFDYIGVNCYYPLSKKDKPSDKELQRNFEDVLNKLENKLTPYNKPVLFTEIGFRSIDEVWKHPHAEATDNSFNQESQARCYEAIFKNLPKNKKWIKGMFWWKWPSYMNYASRRKQSFAPTKKKAETVIKHWFEKL